jgi:hypothetical protein
MRADLLILPEAEYRAFVWVGSPYHWNMGRFVVRKVFLIERGDLSGAMALALDRESVCMKDALLGQHVANGLGVMAEKGVIKAVHYFQEGHVADMGISAKNVLLVITPNICQECAGSRRMDKNE